MDNTLSLEAGDAARAAFLKRLDDAADYIDVTDEQAKFLEATLGRSEFTAAERRTIDRMRSVYDKKLR